MEEIYVQIAAIVIAVIFLLLAVFHVLLSLGFPLGAATMGGYHRVLPKPFRIVSIISAIILIFMGIVFLQHAKIVSIGLHTNILTWVFTVYLGLNTIANLLSKSKIERNIMTPLSSLAFLLCLLVSTT